MLKKREPKTHILLNAAFGLIGLLIIILIGVILSFTVFKGDNSKLPNPIVCLKAMFNILGGSKEGAAIGIAIGQSMLSFLASFALAIGFAIGSRRVKIIKSILAPFISIMRALPTAILAVLLPVIFIDIKFIGMVAIIISFFIIFPMTYESLMSAFDNTDKKILEMAQVFRVSKNNQIKDVYIPIATPFIFSSLIAGFGLCFKVVLASQVIAKMTMEGSIGGFIVKAMDNQDFDRIIAGGLIAIFISLINELIIKEISRICMPGKYKDRQKIVNFFKRSKHD